jgi:lamin B
MLQVDQRCRDLEDRAYRAQQQQHESIIERDDEIQNLKQIIEQMQSDYQNLLDTKIGLDREISTYRKLLDSEEERLNIGGRLGPSPTINGSATPTATDGTAAATNGPAQRQRLKRPRFEVDEDVIIANGNAH